MIASVRRRSSGRSAAVVPAAAILAMAILTVALLTGTAPPAAADFPRLAPPLMAQLLATARAYGQDRTLLLYCLRDRPEEMAAVHAGLRADLDAAVERLRAAGADPEQTAQFVRAALDRVKPPLPSRVDPSLEPRCADRAIERELRDLTGAALPLTERPPFGTSGL